jgi:HEAT repeat protein
MKSFFSIIFVFGVICALLSNFSHSKETSVESSASSIEPQQKALASLVSKDLDERVSATAELVDHRAELIDKLMQILNSTNSMEIKSAAAFVLGRYQAKEAVPFLVDHLEWEVKNDKGSSNQYIGLSEKDEMLGYSMCFPLINIGMPAVKPVLKKLTETDNPDVGRRCLWVCQRIEGSASAQFRLQEMLENESDPNKKARIQSALDTLADVKRKLGSL